MARKIANRNIQSVSPFATGGGGIRFELLVAVHYLVRLLRQEVPRGMPEGIVQGVHLQQRNLGNPIDDIIVDCKSASGLNRLFLQVKHSVTFSNNKDFVEVIEQTWKQFAGSNFQLNRDAVGIAIGEICNNMTVQRHVGDVLDWARTSSNARVFYQKVSAFSRKTDVLKAFEEGIHKVLGRVPTQKQVQNLLRHFVVVPFDFRTRSGRDTVDCRNLLIASVDQRNTRYAASLFTILYEMASEYAAQAGDITQEALSKRISANATFAVPILQRAGRGIGEILSKRLNNRIAAEKNSKKYIPKVFVEVGEIKDRARLFCHPVLFLRRLANKITDIDLFTINRLMTKSGLKPLRLKCTVDCMKGTFESVEHDAQYLANNLLSLKTSLLDLKRSQRAAVARRVPKNKKHVYNEVCWRIGDIAHALDDWVVEPLLKEVEEACGRVFAIVSRAGQGKTNFVCDFAENCLAKREIPCAFFTGKELGTANEGQLSMYIARAVYGYSAAGTMESLLADIEEEACRKGTAGLIVIDAINEHSDLRVFSQELEGFIEKCMEYPHVRVMLTCRSEYFDARFGNLTRSSFSNRLVVEKEIHEQMGSEHRERLVWGYFRFFKIHSMSMSEHVFKQLSEDTFLLRVFCEAYGDPKAKSEISVGRLRHIRREALLREYFNRKFQSLKSRDTIKTGFLVGTHHPYQEIMHKIIKWMVHERKFSDVPPSIFPRDRLSYLSQLLDEDVLVRRDLSTDSVLGAREVINFTFDACRDFLLADYLLNVVFKTDTGHFQTLIGELTHEQCTVAEGLQGYLFYASRHLQDSNATTMIKSQPWYDSVFVNYVFDLDCSDQTEEDANKLQEICLSGDYRTPSIACNLIVNYNPDLSPYINIRILFEVFDTMSQSDFHGLCRGAFATSRYGLPRGVYPIDKLVRDIRSVILVGAQKWSPMLIDLVSLLLYLWDMEDAYYKHPARNLFYEFSQKHPRIAKRLMDKHITKERKGYCKEKSLW